MPVPSGALSQPAGEESILILLSVGRWVLWKLAPRWSLGTSCVQGVNPRGRVGGRIGQREGQRCCPKPQASHGTQAA